MVKGVEDGFVWLGGVGVVCDCVIVLRFVSLVCEWWRARKWECGGGGGRVGRGWVGRCVSQESGPLILFGRIKCFLKWGWGGGRKAKRNF